MTYYHLADGFSIHYVKGGFSEAPSKQNCLNILSTLPRLLVTFPPLSHFLTKYLPLLSYVTLHELDRSDVETQVSTIITWHC